MAGILLTHGNHVFSDPKQTSKMQPYPPLQTILCAAVLREQGLETALFDPTLAEDPRAGFCAALQWHKPRLVAVCEDDFNFLSKMCLARNRELAFWMAKAADEAGIPAVVHGSDASDHPVEFLNAGFRAVLIGEVETTLLEVAQGKAFVPKSRDLCTAGAMRRTSIHGGRSNGSRYSPEPAWDLIDIESYRKAWISAHGYFSLNVASSRGCPYRCNWCAKPVYGNSYHVRSPESVAAEMLFLKSAFRPDHLWFADDIFALSPRWTSEFADAVEQLGARIPFKMQSRCDLMTRSTVAALRRAGCGEVWMGAESGSQRILDAMDKGIRVDEIYQARENLRRNGIRVLLFSAVRLSRRNMGRDRGDDPDGAGNRARTISASPYRIRCPGRDFIRSWQLRWVQNRTGRTAAILP